jgi:predicted transcriptional regulator of viral defense system
MRPYLDSYIESLLSNGCYTFTRSELLKQFSTGEAAIRQCLQRLSRNKVVLQIRNGFYIIIPPEHRNAGILPPEMFIREFMKHLNRPYYVGLLSAAALHGAGHQQPQNFSVITEKPAIRPIELNNLNIRFYVKSAVPAVGVEQKKTPAGYFNVSSPELTALDLMTYLKQSGGIASVAAILEELAENMAPEKLAIPDAIPSTALQRLGYIFDEVLDEKPLANTLWAALQKRSFFHTPLNPVKSPSNCPINKQWKVYINIDLESEL